MGQKYTGRIVRWLGAFAGRQINLADLLEKEITRSDREVAATLEGQKVTTEKWVHLRKKVKKTYSEEEYKTWLESYTLKEYVRKEVLSDDGQERTIFHACNYIDDVGRGYEKIFELEITFYKKTVIVSDHESDIDRPDVGLWLSDTSVTKHFVTDVWSVKDKANPGRLRPTHRAAKCNAHKGHAELFCRPQLGWIRGIVTRDHPARLTAEIQEAVLSASKKHGLPIFYPTKNGWKKV